MRTLGQTPAIRIGRAPKRLLVYRAAEPFAGFKYPPIEVLGLGQQFVAYGLHPDTGRALRNGRWRPWRTWTWRTCRPSPRRRRGPLPSRRTSSSQRTSAPRASAVGRHAPAKGPTRPSSAAPSPRSRRPCDSSSNADLDYDSWVRIGLAIKGALGDEGWPLFEAWSASARKNDPTTTAKAWASFKPTQIGAGTLYRLALERGWSPAPDSAAQRGDRGERPTSRQRAAGVPHRPGADHGHGPCAGRSPAAQAAARGVGPGRRRDRGHDVPDGDHGETAAAGAGAGGEPVRRGGAHGAQVPHQEQRPLESLRGRHRRERLRQESRPRRSQRAPAPRQPAPVPRRQQDRLGRGPAHRRPAATGDPVPAR